VEGVPDRVFDGLTDGVLDLDGEFVRVTDVVRVFDCVGVELNELPLDGVFV
jgi:hypothetical protein